MRHLLTAIENGTFKKLGKPDRVIETLLSKLFFFGDEVYKVYKHEKAFYGDFSDDRFRHEFYHDDFTWNNTMAPDVYSKLGYVKETAGEVAETTHDESQDYYILMKKIDDSKTLFNLLKSRSVKKADLEVITKEMLARVEKLTEIKKSDLKDLFETSYRDLDQRNLDGIRQWLYMGEKVIAKTASDSIVDKLKHFVATNEYFSNFQQEQYVTSIDNHSGNILFNDGKVNFMPPMRIWRIQSDAYTVSRPATDAEVLMGKEYADIMYDTLEKVRGTRVDQKVRAYLQCVAALIMAPYLHVLKDDELAMKYWEFAETKVAEL
jgi:aminoglycoside phosphotransferase family enzyme